MHVISPATTFSTITPATTAPYTFLPMLQPKQILKVLSQAIAPRKSEGDSESGPISIMLLSSKGLPLTTVNVPDLPDPEYLKIYSLWATSSLRQQEKSGNEELDRWSVLDLDGTLRAMVQAFTTFESGEIHEEMYVALFYRKDYDDALAKVMLDAVTEALSAGLQGYVQS